jgi:hypothetical protein
MYAHQVIEDLEWFKQYLNPVQVGALDKSIKLITNSQKFHFGDWDDGLNDIHNAGVSKQKEFFQGKYKLPYPLCFFTFIYAPLKRCFLLNEVGEDLISCVCADWNNSTRRWMIYPIDNIISLNKPLLKNSTFDSFTDFCKLDDIRQGIGDAHIVSICINGWQKEYDQIFKTEKNIFGFMLSQLNVMLDLLNCKNITTETTPAPAKLNKKRKKKGKLPIFSYKTLVIKPTGKKQQSVPKHLWNNRIHLARGHFKTYTAEKPLFGSITGRFWWQPHVRGQNRDGVVMKDYKVEA